MRELVWDRPSVVRRYRDRFRTRPYQPVETGDQAAGAPAPDQAWLDRQLHGLRHPRRRFASLPTAAATGVAADIDGLRSACGLNPLPHRTDP